MSKKLTSFRLKKGEIEYLDYVVKKGYFENKTEALSKIIEFYKQENGFKFELKQKFAVLVERVYTGLIPLLFGSLFAWFFFKRTFLFIPFLLVALMPFVLKLEAKNNSIIKVSL